MFPPDFDAEDTDLVRAVAPYTMTSPERIFALRRAVQYVVRSNIPGDIVECGVWRGGSMLAVARTLQRVGATRSLFLFDTFEGMTPPTQVDRAITGQTAAELLAGADRQSSDVWGVAPLELVQNTLRSSGYEESRIHYVKGRVEDTLPAQAPAQIALLRLDTDWYESTYHELVCLYPRLMPGGVLIIDDYGHWEGARRAVNQYFLERRTPIMLNRIDYTGRIGIKMI